jgi:hypothetical protein
MGRRTALLRLLCDEYGVCRAVVRSDGGPQAGGGGVRTVGELARAPLCEAPSLTQGLVEGEGGLLVGSAAGAAC